MRLDAKGGAYSRNRPLRPALNHAVSGYQATLILQIKPFGLIIAGLRA